MKSVVLILLAVVGIVYCGPIDDGLLEPGPRRANPSPDAVILDVGEEAPYQPPRRQFLRPFFERDDFDDDDDDDLGYGSFLGVRPFGLGFGFRPFREDFFSNLRRQMDLFRRYMSQFLNTTTFVDSTGQFPPNYDNSTFTTKVVNGSVISVNETIKKHTTNDSAFVLTVKVIKVRPQNETTNKEGQKPETLPEEPAFASWPFPGLKPETEEVETTVQAATSSPAIPTVETTPIPTEDEISNDVNPKGIQFR